MGIIELLHGIKRYHDIYFHHDAVKNDVAVAYINGFASSHGGCQLLALREWLITKLGFGNNLTWAGLMLHLAFPGSESPRQILKSNSSSEIVAIKFLSTTLI